MTIKCPNCATTYKVSASVFDEARPTFRCNRCKHLFMVQVRLELTEEQSSLVTPLSPEPTTETSPISGQQEAPVPPEPPQDEQEIDLAEDDIPPPTTGVRQGLPSLPPEIIGFEIDSAAQDPVNPDVDEGNVRDAPTSYRGFEIDTRERNLPELSAVDSTEQAALMDVKPPTRNQRQPDFEVVDDFLLPPAREIQPTLQNPDANLKGSIVPVVSLVGLAMFAFALVTLIYHVKPQRLDSLIRWIPWYGSAVFDSRHFKRTLVFESLMSGIRPVRNDKKVFIVSGKVTNRNGRSVHKVRIEARLFDAEGKQIGQQVTYIGNAISAKIIQDMTLREIKLLQSLKPQNNYQICGSDCEAQNRSAVFTVVFPKPERAVSSFTCRVVSAEVAT